MHQGEATTTVLFVEFLNDDPLEQHRSEYFPFFQGYLRARGVSTAWVSLDAGRERRPSHPFLVDPSSEQRRLLVDFVKSFGPGVVVFNEKTTEPCLGDIGSARSGTLVIQPPHALLRSPRIATLEEALRLPASSADPDILDQKCVEIAVPDYQRRRLEAGPPATEQLVRVLVEPRCVYGRSIRGNPYFAGIDPSELRFGSGCSFCTHEGSRLRGGRPEAIAEQALTQIRRYHETGAVPEGGGRFMLFIAPLLPHIRQFFEGLIKGEAPPSTFFMSARVDEFLAMEDALEDWLPKLEAAGHRIAFWQMGLENFSADENMRFNKGISPEQIERIVATLWRLEESWPETFSFWRNGGFGMIVFTPWTRTSDLLINAREVQRLGLEACSENLSTRLQLRAGTPLTALAARDDLIVEQQETNPFDVYCITDWGEDEVSWRFQHPEVERIYKVFERLYPREESRQEDRDAFSRQVRALKEERHPITRRENEARVLEALVHAADADASLPVEGLLAAALGVLEPVASPPGDELPDWARRLVKALRQLDQAQHPVLRGFRLGSALGRRDQEARAEVTVEFRREGERVVLNAGPLVEGASHYLRGATFGVSHDATTPLDSDRKRALAKALLQIAERLARSPGATAPATRDPAP